MLHPSGPLNKSEARRHWRYAELRCGKRNVSCWRGRPARKTSLSRLWGGSGPSVEDNWIPQMFCQSSLWRPVSVVVCWNAAVETRDAKRLIKKTKQKTKKTNKAGAVAGSQLATLEEVVEQRTLPKNADYRGQHLPPPPRIPNTPRSSFNDRLIKRNRSLFFSCCHQDLSCLLSVHLSITSPELTQEKWVLGDSISKHNHLVKYF